MRLVLLVLALMSIPACVGDAPGYCYELGSSCGCSDYRKSECTDDECCDWYTGDGCDCR